MGIWRAVKLIHVPPSGRPESYRRELRRPAAAVAFNRGSGAVLHVGHNDVGDTFITMELADDDEGRSREARVREKGQIPPAPLLAFF